MKFHIYQDADGKWRWRAKAGNGRIVADSGQGYSRESGAMRAVIKFVAAARQHVDVVFN